MLAGACSSPAGFITPHLPTVPERACCCRLLVVVDGDTIGMAVWHPTLLIKVAARVVCLLQQLCRPITAICAAAAEGILLLMLQELRAIAQLQKAETATRRHRPNTSGASVLWQEKHHVVLQQPGSAAKAIQLRLCRMTPT